MKKWISVCGYDFSCEKVLYNEFEPLIFICIDQHGQRYLTFTEDDTEYLFVPIGLKNICKLVNDRITIAACAKKQKIGMLLDYINGGYIMKTIPMRELDDELLPDPHEFMEASDEIRRYYNGLLKSAHTGASSRTSLIKTLVARATIMKECSSLTWYYNENPMLELGCKLLFEFSDVMVKYFDIVHCYNLFRPTKTGMHSQTSSKKILVVYTPKKKSSGFSYINSACDVKTIPILKLDNEFLPKLSELMEKDSEIGRCYNLFRSTQTSAHSQTSLIKTFADYAKEQKSIRAADYIDSAYDFKTIPMLKLDNELLPELGELMEKDSEIGRYYNRLRLTQSGAHSQTSLINTLVAYAQKKKSISRFSCIDSAYNVKTIPTLELVYKLLPEPSDLMDTSTDIICCYNDLLSSIHVDAYYQTSFIKALSDQAAAYVVNSVCSFADESKFSDLWRNIYAKY